MLDPGKIRAMLRDAYVEDPACEWLDVNVSSMGLISITIVSNKFEGLTHEQRQQDITQKLAEEVVDRLGFLYLFTPDEANDIDLSPTMFSQDEEPRTWIELANLAINQNKPSASHEREGNLPRTVAFYSYKGGVGRTTALVHTAAILAKRGNKVLVVDLDLEAPSLHLVFPQLTPKPKYGMVDYLYERAYAPQNAYQVHVSEMFGEVGMENTSGRLFVIPAGQMSLNFLAKVDDLKMSALQGSSIWETFTREVNHQLHPDIILVDSRTGINEWGAFSLLEAADDIILFMYPNEENHEGLKVITDALQVLKNSSIHSMNLVLSNVPSTKDGKERARSYWKSIQQTLSGPSHKAAENDADLDDDAEPIIIYYNSDTALADEYPLEHLAYVYEPIANLIDEEVEQSKRKSILSETNRGEIIRSLTFPVGDVTDQHVDLPRFFQRTSHFDKFVDENTSVIRGQTGTGKTTLYWLMLNHLEQAKALAKGRLATVFPISAHGRYKAAPGQEAFRYWSEQLGDDGSWEALWRGYAILRLYQEGKLPPDRHEKFARIYTLLQPVPEQSDEWTQDLTNTLLQLAANRELRLLAKDFLREMDQELQEKNQSVWLLYDDLSEELQESGSELSPVWGGLFSFVRSMDLQQLTNLKCKVFIREDVWQQLNIANKSHFYGRDVLLQWTRIDFMRLALRQIFHSGPYKQLVEKHFPIQDIDTASEEELLDALQILWGLKRENNKNSKYVAQWLYAQLTDASGTTFPRLLGSLLNAAKEHELAYEKQAAVPAPPDRLFRDESLKVGVRCAAKQRIQELRQAYPQLEQVLSRLSAFPATCSQQEMEALYKASGQAKASSFEEFVQTLKDMGLLAEDSRKGDVSYRFADLYVRGAGMTRGAGRA